MLVCLVRSVLIFLFLALWSTACPVCKDEFWRNGYIPDYANDVKSTNLKVKYAGQSIQCGSTVNLLQALNPPTVKFDLPGRCKYATVMAFTPDSVVPNPYLSWLVTNIPTDNVRRGFTTPAGLQNTKNNGDLLADYVVPKDPTGGSGIRKTTIIVFVYCQCSYNNDKDKIVRLIVNPFDVKDYAKKHKLGDPVAGFFHLFSATGVTLPKLLDSPIIRM